MGKSREDLIKEAEDTAAQGMAVLGLDAQGKPLEAAPPDSQQPTGDEPAPGQEGEVHPGAPEHQDKPQDEPAATDTDKAPEVEPTATPAVEEPAHNAQVDVAQLQSNYDHLRSYADRTSGENAQLRSDNASLKKQVADLQSQIQILLAAQPSDKGQPKDTSTAQQEAGGDGTGDVGAPAQTSTQMEKLINAEQSLDALAEEFPDTLAPVVNYLKEFKTLYGDRITNVENTVDTKIKPVVDTITEDTKRRAKDDLTNQQKEHYGKIANAYPNWNEMVFADVENGILNPSFDQFLLNHPAGGDYFSLLFPEQGKQGASAGMVIKILEEFSNSEYGKGTAQAIIDERTQAAEGDVQTDRRPKPMVPDNTNLVNPVEKLKAGQTITRTELQDIMKVCHGDSVKWNEYWPLVQKAQAENRIVDTGNIQSTYHL